MEDILIYCYYGDLDKFKEFYSVEENKRIFKIYDELHFCIFNGIKLNREFALYMYENFYEFLEGPNFAFYNLILDKIDKIEYYYLYYISPLVDVENENLTDFLSFNYLINKNKDKFLSLKLKKRFILCQYFIDNFGLEDYYNKNIVEFSNDIKYNMYIHGLFRFNSELVRYDYDLYSPNYYDDYYEEYFCIEIVDRINLNNFLNKKEYYSRDYNEFNVDDILVNTSLAIYCYKNKLHINYCICRFMMIDPKGSYELYVKYKPFITCKSIPHISVLNFYKDIDSKVYLNLLYYYIIYFESVRFNSIPEFPNFIEYNIYEGARKSCSKKVFDFILNKIDNGYFVYKYIDLDSKTYLDEPILIDSRSLNRKMEFDISIYTI